MLKSDKKLKHWWKRWERWKNEKKTKKRWKHDKTAYMNQYILKIWQDERWQKDEIVDRKRTKNEKMIKWWKDDTRLNIDDYNCRARMDNPTCDSGTNLIGWWRD